MSFDTLAPHYRWMELLLAGRKLHRCRTAFLDEVPVPGKILLLGEGHGRFLVECRERFPNARITCLDASAKMLEQSKRQLDKRALGTDSVQFVHCDVLKWNPGEHDLIISNFFLDCFRAEQLEQIISKIGGAATARANWLIADFQAAPHGWRRMRSRLILAMMYFFFRTVTRLPAHELTPPDAFMQRAGFALHRRKESEWALLHADWWKRL